jgi:hypothetical protein
MPFGERDVGIDDVPNDNESTLDALHALQLKIAPLSASGTISKGSYSLA